MSVRDEIIAQFKQVASEQNRQLAALEDALPLLDSGLDSLCFAIIVVRLEDVLGTDPFQSRAARGWHPVTFADFVGAYDNVRK